MRQHNVSVSRINKAVTNSLSQSEAPQNQILPAFYTVEEACIRLALPKQTARNWINDDVFVVKTKRMRGRRVVPVILLEEYIQKMIYEDDFDDQADLIKPAEGQKRKAGRPPNSKKKFQAQLTNQN